MPQFSPAQTILRYIGANVRRLRRARGWTQVELADATGLKERYIQILETGKANPTVKVLVEAALRSSTWATLNRSSSVLNANPEWIN